ncbi:MAG: hypothetical protein IJS97_00570 [Prevotella sp.]|nr:hypothetical protein [Prevotella sp.]
MDSEEKYLVERFGRKQPFKVPEGYFEQFNAQLMAQLMAQLPANESNSKAKFANFKVARYSLLRPIAAAAVGLTLFVSGLTLYLHRSDVATTEPKSMARIESSVNNGDFDEVADYTMMDNEDFYAYVAGY